MIDEHSDAMDCTCIDCESLMAEWAAYEDEQEYARSQPARNYDEHGTLMPLDPLSEDEFRWTLD